MKKTVLGLMCFVIISACTPDKKNQLAGTIKTDSIQSPLSDTGFVGNWQGVTEFSGGYKHYVHIYFYSDSTYIFEQQNSGNNAKSFEIGNWWFFNDSTLELEGNGLHERYLAVTKDRKIEYRDENGLRPSNYVSSNFTKNKGEAPYLPGEYRYEGILIARASNSSFFMCNSQRRLMISKTPYYKRIAGILKAKGKEEGQPVYIKAYGYIDSEGQFRSKTTEHEFHLVKIVEVLADTMCK